MTTFSNLLNGVGCLSFLVLIWEWSGFAHSMVGRRWGNVAFCILLSLLNFWEHSFVSTSFVCSLWIPLRLRPFGARSCSIDSSPMVAVWDNCFGEHNALATLIAGFSLLEVRISIESKLLVLVMDSSEERLVFWLGVLRIGVSAYLKRRMELPTQGMEGVVCPSMRLLFWDSCSLAFLRVEVHFLVGGCLGGCIFWFSLLPWKG